MPSSLIPILERHSATEPMAFGQTGYTGIDVPSLRAALEKIPDPRARRGVRYPFAELLLVLVCAVFSGAKSLTMILEWARHAATIDALFAMGKVPSLATIHRLAARIDPDALDQAVNGWASAQARSRARSGPAVIAVDGKEVRGAKNGTGARVFLMAALDHGTGAVIGQESIGEKTNEIPHFGALMDKLGTLSGTVITADALHTQSGHATDLHARGAHYVFTVKANQRRLRSGSAPRPGPGAGPNTCNGKRRTDAPPSGPPRRTVPRNGSTFPTALRPSASPATGTTTPPGIRPANSSSRLLLSRRARHPPKTWPATSAVTGALKTASTGCGTSPTVKTPRRYAPETVPTSWPLCATSPSASTAWPAQPISPKPSAPPHAIPESLETSSDFEMALQTFICS